MTPTATDTSTAPLTGPRVGRRALARRGAPGALYGTACLVAAVASLPIPAMLGYDPWVWLVWGRELLRGELATDGTVAWKPLPVLVTTLLAPAGPAAPVLWTVLARAGGLFGMVMVIRLAARLAAPIGRPAGAISASVAAVAFLLGPDGEARWVRHVLQANIEPVTVALCLAAVYQHLDGRRSVPLLLLTAAALTRPEVWPMLVLYAGWLLYRGPRRWWAPVLAALGSVPLLWFGGDLLMSGDPLGGATAARVLEGTGTQRLLIALDAVAGLVILPVLLAAAIGVVCAARRREPAPVLLAAATVAWLVEVVLMAGLFGYAALGRFMAPAAAGLCVLAGIGAAWLVLAPRRLLGTVGRSHAAAACVLVGASLLAVALPAVLPRLAWLPAQFEAAAHRAAFDTDLDRVLAVLGPDRASACGLPIAVDAALPAVEFRSALVWKLDLPLAGVAYGTVGNGLWFTQRGSIADRSLAAIGDGGSREIVSGEHWVVRTQHCAALSG